MIKVIVTIIIVCFYWALTINARHFCKPFIHVFSFNSCNPLENVLLSYWYYSQPMNKGGREAQGGHVNCPKSVVGVMLGSWAAFTQSLKHRHREKNRLTSFFLQPGLIYTVSGKFVKIHKLLKSHRFSELQSLQRTRDSTP